MADAKPRLRRRSYLEGKGWSKRQGTEMPS